MDTVNAPASINPAQLSALLGKLNASIILVDVRKTEDFAESAVVLPGALRWDYCAEKALPAELAEITSLVKEPAANMTDISVVAYCVKGLHVGIDGAARLRALGFNAVYLEGGILNWQAAGYPTLSKTLGNNEN